MGKVLILSAPSGAGKSTIVKYLLENIKGLEFSVSATSRAPRGVEKNGVDYHFLSTVEFRNRIEQGEFIEFEEVYDGLYYGTLKSEVERIWEKGNIIVFDIDVMGGINLKKRYGNNALSLFIQPPSIDELRNRLTKRGTDTPEAIDKRVAKAQKEMEYRYMFDEVIINDNLEECLAKTEDIVKKFLNK